MSERIIFFCDGGISMGMGHITRCGALAEEFAGDFDVSFVVNGEAPVTGFEFQNAGTHAWPELARDAICVIDSYTISSAEVEGVWRSAKACLWIDDENLRIYPGGSVVNPSLFGDELNYNNPTAKHLLGPDYVIIRRAFRRRYDKTINKTIAEITVIMGGTDASGLLPRFVDELSRFDAHMNIVSPTVHPGTLSGLSAEQIRELFLHSDLVISAGGQTVNELIQLNTPAILVEAAENQRKNIAAAVKRGLAVAYVPGDSLAAQVQAVDYAARQRLYSAMEVYDFANGVSNIVKSFLEQV